MNATTTFIAFAATAALAFACNQTKDRNTEAPEKTKGADAPLRTKPSDTGAEKQIAKGAGFSVPVPTGFEVTAVPASARVGVPEGTVTLGGKPSGGGGYKSSILIVPVQKVAGFVFKPTDLRQCQETARGVAAGNAKADFEGAKIIDIPGMGKTCEAFLSEGDSVRVRMVVLYRREYQVAATCRANINDNESWQGCQQVIETLTFTESGNGRR